MNDLLRAIEFFINANYDFEVKQKEKHITTILVDNYVYSYNRMTGDFINKMPDYLVK